MLEREDYMKNTTFLCLLCALGLMLPSMAMAQGHTPELELSKPIPVVQRDEAGAAALQTGAISLRFFDHPENAGRFGNLEIDLPSAHPFRVEDLIATPGARVADEGAEVINDMMERIPHPESGTMIFGGIAPSGLNLNLEFNTSALDGSVDISLQPVFTLSRTNHAVRQIMFANIQGDPDGQLIRLLGDPTDQFFFEPGVMGEAQALAPYDNAETLRHYPAAISSTEGFHWCRPFSAPLYSDDCSNLPGFADITDAGPYTDVFLFDTADIGTGIVAPSYDPFNLHVKNEFNLSADVELTVLRTGTTLSYHLHQPVQIPNKSFNFSYMSPLAFFRKDGDQMRYRFTGYRSWDLPQIEINTGNNPPFEMEKILHELFSLAESNTIVPRLTNPVAVETMDLHGGRKITDGPLALAYRDGDVAVAYQASMRDLTQYILGIFGRPAMFEVGSGSSSSGTYSHYAPGTWSEMLVTMTQPPADVMGTCYVDQSTPLGAGTADYPHTVVAPVAFYRQNEDHAWNASTDFEAMNPTSFMDMAGTEASGKFIASMALVGPGMYDMAVLTDEDDLPSKRHQTVVVPSGIPFCQEVDGVNVCKGVISLIDPLDEERRIYMYLNKADKRRCVATPLVKPEFLLLDPPSGGDFVPYGVTTGHLNGESDTACEDLIVTWRGAHTVVNDLVAADSENVRFDAAADGLSQKMFSNAVTVIRRIPGNDGCEPQEPFNNLTLDASVQIASATIGDFNGDNITDIAAGNLTPEAVGEGMANAFASYAHVFYGALDAQNALVFSSMDYSPGVGGVKRVRVGSLSATSEAVTTVSEDRPFGVGRITAERKDGADALAQISGLPLMLPEIGCAVPTEATATVVATPPGIYEGMVYNMTSTQYGNGIPIPYIEGPAGAQYPIAPHCRTIPGCNKGMEGGNDLYLPFFGDDPATTDIDETEPCCTDPCTCPLEIYCYHPYDTYSDLIPSLKAFCDYRTDTSLCPNQPECGNGTIETSEQCETDSDCGSSNATCIDCQCIVPTCGNGIIDFNLGEACDTGSNTPDSSDDHVGCFDPNPTCAPKCDRCNAVCGDGTIGTDEQCESDTDCNTDETCDDCQCVTSGAALEVENNMRFAADGENDSDSADSGETDYAAWRPDVVVSASNGDAIALVGNLVPVATVQPLESMTDLFENKEAMAALQNTFLETLALVEGTYEGYELKRFMVARQLMMPKTRSKSGVRSKQQLSLGCQAIPTGGIGTLDPAFSSLLPLELLRIIDIPLRPLVPVLGAPLSLKAHIPMPRGQDMPGAREMSVVVPLERITCNRNGAVDLDGEQCDTADLSPDEQAAHLSQYCDENPEQLTPLGCEMDCSCMYQVNHCGPEFECQSDYECADGQVCTYDCFCSDQRDLPIPGDDDDSIVASQIADARCHVDTYSSEAAATMIKALNARVQDATGVEDYDLFVEPMQTMTCFIRVRPAFSGSQAQLSASASTTEVPPWMFVQTSGTAFDDASQMTFRNEIRAVQQPMRILPVVPAEPAAAQMAKAFSLPNLSSSGNPAIQAIAPSLSLTATSLTSFPQNRTIVNNMIDHRAVIAAPGVSGDFAAAQQGPLEGPMIDFAAQQSQSGPPSYVHIIRLRMPTTFGSFGGMAGAPDAQTLENLGVEHMEDLYIENRMMDPEAVISFLAAKKNAGAQSDSRIFTPELPWDGFQNVQITLVQDAAGQPVPLDVRFAALVGEPGLMGSAAGTGGCKGCYVAGAPATAANVLPTLLVVFLSVGGIAIGRVRRRRKR